MKSRLRMPLFTLLLTLLCFGFSSDGWGQGQEDFSNLPTNSASSYLLRTWTGTDNLTWTAEGARTDQTMNGKALTWGNSGTRNVISPSYTGGMGVLTFDYVRAFTGTSARSLEVYVNGIQIGGVITVSPTSDVVVQYSETINVSGPVVLEIKSTGAAQVKVDDIMWTGFTSSVPSLFASPTSISDLNYYESAGPSASQPFVLSGANLDGTNVTVSLPALSDFEISNDDISFTDNLIFPAYTGGTTTIYARLKSGLPINIYSDIITISGGGANLVTVTLNGEVQPVPVLGWQTDAINTPFLINFDTTVNGVNEGQYAGTGFVPLPAMGQLNSNAFASTGMSDGNPTFGDTSLTGDFTGGTSTGGVTGGGFYAFEVAPGNHAFGFQPTGADFSPGSVTLRLQNQTGSAVTAVDLAYLIYEFNDQGRASSFNFSYSEDNISYTAIPALDFISTELASTSPTWEVFPRNTLITGLNIPAGAFFYMRWDSDDISGGGSRDEFALDNIRVILNPVSNTYVYQTGSWTPTNPNGVITANDKIVIVDGTATLTADMVLLDITVASGATLNVAGAIKADGNIINDGSLVFISNATTTGQLDSFTGIITGNVEIQRYLPARRAFRLLSSAVTTTTNINANWQEGALLATDNPSPGFGTHITGSATGADGFDATPSGNASLFTLDNAAQSWIDVTNTDVNTLAAGAPYRILVRGDRSIDVTSNTATATNTTLRATGTLFTGTFTDNSFSVDAGDFNFFGNPYQAAVNMNSVVADSENINPGFYYIWDPTLNGNNGRGAYVTIDLPLGGTNPVNSDANQYLQPGQAAFVTTLLSAPASLTIEETHKAVAQPQTAVFDTPVKLDLRLYEAAAFANANTPADGLRIKFENNGTNAINSMDAPKFYNQDENLATMHNSKLYSMESRAIPQPGENITLYTDQYRATEYIFEADLMNLEGVSAYLKDTFTGDEILLGKDDMTIYSFSITPGNAASIADDRFEIFFADEVLGTADYAAENNFVVFPNPVENNRFFIATRGMEGETVSLSISNMLGQNVLEETRTLNNGGKLQVNLPELPAGIYTVTMKAANGNRFTTKLINR